MISETLGRRYKVTIAGILAAVCILTIASKNTIDVKYTVRKQLHNHLSARLSYLTF